MRWTPPTYAARTCLHHLPSISFQGGSVVADQRVWLAVTHQSANVHSEQPRHFGELQMAAVGTSPTELSSVRVGCALLCRTHRVPN
jgi:hypothetical protein